MAFEAYRAKRNGWIGDTSNPWAAQNKAHDALREIDCLTGCKILIKGLAELDSLVPTIHRVRVLNTDGKGSTQWLLFYPDASVTAPLVRIPMKYFYWCTGNLSVEIYDRRADAAVVQDSNRNYLLDSLAGSGDIPEVPIPHLSKSVATIRDLALLLETPPQPPPFNEADAGTCTIS